MHDPTGGAAGDRPRPRRRIIRRPSPAAPLEPGDWQRLLRLAGACPHCGARPALRVTATMVEALAKTPSAVVVGTYQCQRRGCGAIYPLRADAYQRAS